MIVAHAGEAIRPHDLWSSWSADPLVLALLALAAGAYVIGLRDLWARAGRGRGIARWRAACFGAGIVVLWVALESPVDALGTALFSGHMLQHELLSVVAAPLLVLGMPWVAMARALPRDAQRRLRRFERRLGAGRRARRKWWLVAAFVAYVTTFWVWHLPPLYDAAVGNDAVHTLEHACFLGGALALWWGVAGRHRHRTPLGAIALLFATLTQGAWGGSLFVFASKPYYEAYLETSRPWGLTPLDDVVFGGVVMWTAGLVFILAAAVVVVSWLAAMDRAPKRNLPWEASYRSAPAPVPVGADRASLAVGPPAEEAAGA